MADKSQNIALVAGTDEFFNLALRTVLTGQLGFSRVHIVSSFQDAVSELSDLNDTSLAVVDDTVADLNTPKDLGIIRDSYGAVRTVLISKTDDRRAILAALEAGVHGFIPKSLGLSRLTRALQQVTEGEIYVPPSVADRPLVARPTPRITSLTPRQQDVLRQIVEGQSNKEIARTLSLGEGTVKVHVAALLRTLGLSSRTAAAVVGARILAEADDANAVPGSSSTPR